VGAFSPCYSQAVARAEHPVRGILFDLGNTLVTRPRLWVPGAKEALSLLKDAEIPVGIISNTGTLTREQLLNEHLPVDFSFEDFSPELITLSSEVGFEKPSLAIFALAAERGGYLPGQLLFVDENISQVLAAQRTGMLALRVRIEQDVEGRVVSSDLVELVRELVLAGRQ
jgi:FMN phosphatase YigB (HAD superfamily)